MTNIIVEKLLLKSVDKMSKRYESGQYLRILELANKLYSNNDKPAVYRNIFRVLALNKTSNKLWQSEYGYILKYKQLDVFGQDDATYIRLFLENELNEDLEDAKRNNSMNIQNVSKRTKKYFPIDYDGKTASVKS